MKFCTLFSGSSGNAAYIEEGDTRILIDAGQGIRIIGQALANIGVGYQDLSAIILTHDHSDHIRGVAPISRKYGLPIYGPRMMLEAMIDRAEDLLPDRFTSFSGEGPFWFGDLAITPFSTPHDATESVGYTIENKKGKKLAIATDLGHVPDSVYERLRGADFILIESNYDEDLLHNGRYPYYLKRRILSENGHLSNRDCAECICRLCGDGTRHFLLGHLSKENNVPVLAMQSATIKLQEAGYLPGEITIDIAPRSEQSKIFEW